MSEMNASEATFSTGDVVGCGIVDQHVFFTKNGRLLDRIRSQYLDMNNMRALFASKMSCNAIINVGQIPFYFSNALDKQIDKFLNSESLSSLLAHLRLAQACDEGLQDGRLEKFDNSIDTEMIHEYLLQRLMVNLNDHADDIERCSATFGVGADPLLFRNSLFLRQACALERWEVVSLCLKQDCGVDYNGYEAGYIAGLFLANDDPLMDQLLPPAAWNALSAYTVIQKVLLSQLGVVTSDRSLTIRAKLANLLSHRSAEENTAVIALFGNQEVRACIENDCREVIQIYFDTREIAQMFLDKWLTVSLEVGSFHICQMLKKRGGNLPRKSPVHFHSIVIPNSLQRDGRVSYKRKDEAMEFYGKPFSAISGFPISEWHPGNPEKNQQPHYVELFVEKMSELSKISLGIVTLSRFSETRMAGEMTNSLGCFRYIFLAFNYKQQRTVSCCRGKR